MPTLGEALLYLLTRVDAEKLLASFKAKCLGCGHDVDAMSTSGCPVCGMNRFSVTAPEIDLAALSTEMGERKNTKGHK